MYQSSSSTSTVQIKQTSNPSPHLEATKATCQYHCPKGHANSFSNIKHKFAVCCSPNGRHPMSVVSSRSGRFGFLTACICLDKKPLQKVRAVVKQLPSWSSQLFFLSIYYQNFLHISQHAILEHLMQAQISSLVPF